MNPCAVSIDLARYDRKCCEEDARTAHNESEADNLRDDWKRELKHSGRIDDIDKDESELMAEAVEQQISFADHLWNSAYEYVINNEEQFKPEPLPDLDWS